MKTKVGLQQVKGRKLPWRVYWHGTPDENGKQRQHTKAYKHNHEAKAFQVEKQAELNRHGPRDHLEAVTLGRLLDEFQSSRLAALKYATQISYGNTTKQLREYFGDDKPVRQIRQQHAEAFIVSRRRVKTRKDAAKNKDRFYCPFHRC